jgi:hypothetical protein
VPTARPAGPPSVDDMLRELKKRDSGSR